MNNDRNLNLTVLHMYYLNFVIVVFYSLVSNATAFRIARHFQAYEFLSEAGVIPNHPWRMPVQTILLFAALLSVSVTKNVIRHDSPVVRFCFILAEIILCIGIIEGLNFYYSGIALVVLADLVNYMENNGRRIILMIVLASVYVIGRYDIIPLAADRIAFASWLSYYSQPVRTSISLMESILVSANIILFVYYMVMLFTSQKAENERIVSLNEQLREANRKLREFALELERMAEIRERNRLAREIHDTLGHTLTGIIMGSEASLALFEASPEESKKRIEAVTRSARDGLNDVRASIKALRPDSLQKQGLEMTLREMIAKFQKTTNVAVIYEQFAGKLEFAVDEEDTLYRIIQECMTNAVRHGHADVIQICIRRHDDILTVDIRDNGSGCETVTEGFGLRHMQERLDLLSGSLTYGNRADDPNDGKKGFYVIASLPVRRRQQEE